jgi:hypothetical protein
MLFVRRDWRAIWAAGVTWAATIVASLVFVGFRAWQEWWDYLPQYHSVLAAKNRLGMAISPAFAADYFNLPGLPFMVVGFFVGLSVLWSARRSRPEVQCAAIACASLLSAPYAMTYDLTPVVPFLIVEIWIGSIIAAVAATGALAPASLVLTASRIWLSERQADLSVSPPSHRPV